MGHKIKDTYSYKDENEKHIKAVNVLLKYIKKWFIYNINFFYFHKTMTYSKQSHIFDIENNKIIDINNAFTDIT